MTHSHTQEKRKYVRIPNKYTIHVEKYAIPRSKTDTAEAHSKNLSAGGILFETTQIYNLGDTVRLEIDIPNWNRYNYEFYKPDKLLDQNSLVIIGQVIRVEDMGEARYEVGVSFHGMDEGHRLALQNYIKHNP